MSIKVIKIIELAKEYKYKVVKGYVHSNTKIVLSCTGCTQEREVLPKSFIINPKCSSCLKISLDKINSKKRITDLNIELRSKAKKNGFKLTEWFDEIPKKITISCRMCNTDCTRAVNSIRNGLVCFTCKKKNPVSKNFKVDIDDIPYLINEYIIKEKPTKNIPKAEEMFLTSLIIDLKLKGKVIINFDENTNIFLCEDGTSIRIQDTPFVKKFLLGNSIKSSKSGFINDVNLGINKNTTINNIEDSISIKYFNEKIFEYYIGKIRGLDEENVKLLFKTISPKFSLIKVNQRNKYEGFTSMCFSSSPTKVKVVQEKTIDKKSFIVVFNNGNKFRLRISTSSNKDVFGSWDNLFQESWELIF